MAAVTMEDLLKPHLRNLSQKKLILISKGLSFLYGAGCITVAALSFLLDWGVLQGSFTVMGLVSGPILGAFILGMFIPATNKAGVFSGVSVGFAISLWLAVGSTLYPPSDEIMGVLPSPTGKCLEANVTLHDSLSTDRPSRSVSLHPATTYIGALHQFYSMSYLYFGAVGTSSAILAGLLVSYATGPTDRNSIGAGLLWWDLHKTKLDSSSWQEEDSGTRHPQLVPLKDAHGEDARGQEEEEAADVTRQPTVVFNDNIS